MNEPTNQVAINYRIKREDGLYLCALSPQTDQPVWVKSSNAALVFLGEDQVAATIKKLRGRGIPVRHESFRAPTQTHPTPPQRII